ncbi:UDP-glucosyltransferase 2-like [Culicoides brevitarsis]|uniref:UDP-glucosyltransferase 2-like n=1 Tax=Culicoides brevitarsis TaxID=469753 RepID=UPI00307B4714
MKLLPAFFFIILFNAATSYRILGLFIHPGRSHYVVYSPLMKTLAQRGHNVTVVSYFPEKTAISNYRDLPFAAKIDLTESFDISRYTPINGNYLGYFRELFELAAWGNMACEGALNDPVIDLLLKMHEKAPFDLVITEFFETDCMLGVIWKMQVPFIGLSSCVLMPWHPDRIATPSTPSHIASEFVGFTEKMSFYERFVSFTVSNSVKFLYRWLVERKDNELLAAKFGEGIPDVHEIAKNTSFIFVNQHFSLHQARPMAPNLIEIGGIHIQDEKPLEKELKSILDAATNGVILMSWGSMINASTMETGVRDIFLNVFRGLEQKVVWKYETEKIENLPKNVVLRKWIQQRDILCHPNVKVFISHGGMLGTTEAIYCGVPVITIPFYGDQPLNGAAMEYRGIGEKIWFEEIETEKIRNSILKMLSDEVQQRAKFMSENFKDRPMAVLDTAVYWTEYAIRTKGELIRSHARHMSWFVYYSLDVLLPIIFVFLTIFYTIFKIHVMIFKIVGKKSEPKKKETKVQKKKQKKN